MFFYRYGSTNNRGLNGANNVGNNMDDNSNNRGAAFAALDTCITCLANPGDMRNTHYMPDMTHKAGYVAISSAGIMQKRGRKNTKPGAGGRPPALQ